MSEDSGTAPRRIPDMIVRGLSEHEILAHAPVLHCDRVHWVSPEPLDTRIVVAELHMEAYTRTWSDGQQRIWVPRGEGSAARERIRDWCSSNLLDAQNLRIESGVPFRNVDAIPGDLFPELVLATVDWLYPRSYAIRRKIVADLDLIDDDDVRQMMYLFVSDHADRFDSERQGRNGAMNFASFMLGKLRKWPQDAARSAYGRTLVDDAMQLNLAREQSMMTAYRRPTESELADRMKTTVLDLRSRERAVAEFSGIRHYDSLVTGSMANDPESVDAADDGDVAAAGLAFSTRAALTRAILDAACAATTRKGGPDSLALAAVYLSFWGGLTRAEVAAELGVQPRTAGQAMQRIITTLADAGGIDPAALADFGAP